MVNTVMLPGGSKTKITREEPTRNRQVLPRPSNFLMSP
jgi:hypothetical protein